MALINFTAEIQKAKKLITQLEELLATNAGNKQNYEDLVNCRKVVLNYQAYISKVLDAIIELYEEEDKSKPVGVSYKIDYNKVRKSLDNMVFSKEGSIVHLQIREDMDKSSYKITILDNDQLKAERL